MFSSSVPVSAKTIEYLIAAGAPQVGNGDEESLNAFSFTVPRMLLRPLDKCRSAPVNYRVLHYTTGSYFTYSGWNHNAMDSL